MVASVSSPEDLINLALVPIGYRLRIGSIWEGSVASRKALDVYAQTRDAMLSEFDWGFAKRDATMTLLKQAPANGGYVPGVTPWNGATNPAIPYLFEYAYPADCLQARAVKPAPLFFPNVDPQHYVFSVENDHYLNPTQKVILCNVAPPAILAYTGQLTDLSQWDANAIEAFAATIGRRLAPSLVGPEMLKLLMPIEAQDLAVAESREG